MENDPLLFIQTVDDKKINTEIHLIFACDCDAV